MSRRPPPVRSHEEEPPASAGVSRLLVMGFLTAALLGFVLGVLWVGWQLIKHHVGG
ncbi:MAG: hypothetical protein ABIX28_20280 [Vicinamibacterales bacterium]